MLANIPLNHKTRQKLTKDGISLNELLQQLNDTSLNLALELYKAQGLNIIKKNEKYFYESCFISLKDAIFCIVDIETNGSQVDKHQIIEIGAVKIQNNQIIGKYESLVYCKNINKNIVRITGINAEQTKDAPPLKQVMKEFRFFLADSIFVAHDVKFDFKFISAMMKKVNLGELFNRHICSIGLAERTIISYRYSLSYLNELLKLYQEATHHRAMSDAITTTKLFIKSLTLLNENQETVEDLIRFSKLNKRLKRPEFDKLANI